MFDVLAIATHLLLYLLYPFVLRYASDLQTTLLGDVTKVIDQNGNIVNSYTYDEWGNILAKQELLPQPLKYAGDREVFRRRKRPVLLRHHLN
jgi:YD repeat-containing protein